MISAWRKVYGESPLHLLGQIVAFAIAIYAYLQIIDVTSTDNLNLLIWFVAGALLHDMLFLPIYLILDLIARLGIQDHALRNVRAINHIRFPLVDQRGHVPRALPAHPRQVGAELRASLRRRVPRLPRPLAADRRDRSSGSPP